MQPEDIRGFFAEPSQLDAEDYLFLDYYFECSGDPETAAAHLCSEQSTAQWKRVGVDEDYRPRFGAKVVDLEVETAAVRHQLPARPTGVRPGQRLPGAHRPSASQFRARDCRT